MANFKNIHIGHMIETKVTNSGIEMSRICNFIKCTEEEILEMYHLENLPTDILLKWSKLLEYDFFRLYTQHLILYAPQSGNGKNSESKTEQDALPKFRKNIYTREIIDFILESLETGEKTKKQIISDYRIPKTTLYKWISKYNLKK